MNSLPGLLFLACLICVLGGRASAADLWASNGLAKVLRDATPPAKSGPVLLEAARNEVASGQAVLWCGGGEVSATLSPLVGPAGPLPAEAVKLQWVRYISVTRNSSGLPERELVAKAPCDLPDPFWEDLTITAPAGEAQPLWIEVTIPLDAAPGDYKGTLSVTTSEGEVSLPVALHVWDFELSPIRHQSVINWWSFPSRGFPDVAAFSDDYWALLARSSAFLVAHRQTDVLASLQALIDESGDSESGYTYDTSKLERYAEVAFGEGIRAIHLHVVGDKSAEITNPISRVIRNESGMRRLPALEEVIVRRGWQGRFFVSLTDEPFIHHEETYAALVDQVHAIAPHVKTLEAVETEYLGDLDVYVPKLNHLHLWYPAFKRHQDEGKELWFYTCCIPQGTYPNRFLDQSLVHARVLHWISYLYDLDGYLHWGLNWYEGDPYTEAGQHPQLPLGDNCVVYPGRQDFLGSLRFSAMRDGLEDYEYLYTLEQKLRALKAEYGDAADQWLDPRQRPLELAKRVIWNFHDFNRDPETLLAARRTIAEEIEALSARPLLYVQTSPPEGTEVPAAWPRNIIVRGLTTPGATVLINGESALNQDESGYFRGFVFLYEHQPTITITATLDGVTRTVTRTFLTTE